MAGMQKHRKSGRANKNFTGKKGGKRTKRKGTSRKMRKSNRGKHKNKYEREQQ